MARFAFSTPSAAAERRRALRRAPPVLAGVLWTARLGVRLAEPEQRGLALSACETLGRAGLRGPNGFAGPPACIAQGRGAICIRAL